MTQYRHRPTGAILTPAGPDQEELFRDNSVYAPIPAEEGKTKKKSTVKRGEAGGDLR
ncbi:MAG: hypothetical protein PHD67_10725 [Oscillospiraceae bacterium]|nr:hypothetical protein [Oscillospiraceae bacterium]